MEFARHDNHKPLMNSILREHHFKRTIAKQDFKNAIYRVKTNYCALKFYRGRDSLQVDETRQMGATLKVELLYDITHSRFLYARHIQGIRGVREASLQQCQFKASTDRFRPKPDRK